MIARVAALAAALALVSGPLIGCGGSDREESDRAWEGETIALGSVFSITGPGVAFGPQQLRAAELAVERINDEGGVRGATLALSQLDDASDPARAAVAMRRLIANEGSLAVLGPTFSNSAASADPIANTLRAPVLAVSNTGPGIVGDCPYPCEWIFRDSLGEAAAIPANVATYAEEGDSGSAVIVHPSDDPFGASTGEIAARALAENGIELLATIRLPTVGLDVPEEVSLAITPLEEADVLVITASSGELAAALIRAVRASGFEGAILGGNAFNSALAAGQAGGAGRGAQSAAAWFAGNDSDENRAFMRAYRRRYDSEPDQFAAQAYTGVLLLAAAAADADLGFDDVPADREALAAALRGVELETPLGPFRFTPDQDVIQPIWVVEMDGRGGYSLVSEIEP